MNTEQDFEELLPKIFLIIFFGVIFANAFNAFFQKQNQKENRIRLEKEKEQLSLEKIRTTKRRVFHQGEKVYTLISSKGSYIAHESSITGQKCQNEYSPPTSASSRAIHISGFSCTFSRDVIASTIILDEQNRPKRYKLPPFNKVKILKDSDIPRLLEKWEEVEVSYKQKGIEQVERVSQLREVHLFVP